MIHRHAVRLINCQISALRQSFLLYHCWLHLKESVLMEKSMRNLSSCHVQTRPAYQALSANMLSSLNQLDPARQRASRRHTPTSYREKGTLCSWPRLKNVFTSTESIISTQLYAASSTHSSSPEQTVVKKLFIALLELLCGVGG